MLDEELIRKIRNKQAKLIKNSNDYVSFSAVLNQYLMIALERRKILASSKS